LLLYSSNLLLGFPTGRSFTSSTTRQQVLWHYSIPCHQYKTCGNQANKITTEKTTYNDTVKQMNTWKRKAKTDRKKHNSLEENSNKAQEKVGAALGKRMGQNKENLGATSTAVFSNKKKKGEGSVLSATPAENDPGIMEEEEATSPGATGQLTGANVSAYQKP
jgi:hypothetical protein